jgi:hypothetical protein
MVAIPQAVPVDLHEGRSLRFKAAPSARTQDPTAFVVRAGEHRIADSQHAQRDLRQQQGADDAAPEQHEPMQPFSAHGGHSR